LLPKLVGKTEKLVARMLSAIAIGLSFIAFMLSLGAILIGDDGIEYEHWEDVDFNE